MINIGKKCLAALLAASMVFGVTGCGRQKKAKKPYVQSTAEVKNGTAKAEGKGKQQSEVPLIIGCGRLDKNFNPFLAQAASDEQVMNLTQTKLFDTDRAGRLVEKGIDGELREYNDENYTYYGIADIKKARRTKANYTVYRITIRDDLLFSDGQPITIDDVIFSLYAFCDNDYDGNVQLKSSNIRGLLNYQANNAQAESYTDKQVKKYIRKKPAALQKWMQKHSSDESGYESALERQARYLMAKQAKKKTRVNSIEGIKRLNDYELRIYTTGYDSRFEEKLQIPICPLHYYGDTTKYSYNANKFGFKRGDLSAIRANKSSPVGAGAYRFVKYDSGIAYFMANELYYQGCPKITYVQLKDLTKLFKDEDLTGAKLAEEMKGQTVDVASLALTQPDLEAIGEINGNGKMSGNEINTCQSANASYAYWGLNPYRVCINNEPFSEQSAALRHAIAMVVSACRGVQMETEGAKLTSVNAQAAKDSWLSPEQPNKDKLCYAETLDGKEQIYKTDDAVDQKREEAQQTALKWLEKAGYTVEDGKVTAAPADAKTLFSMELAGGTDTVGYQLATAVASDLQGIGITIQIHTTTVDKLNKKVANLRRGNVFAKKSSIALWYAEEEMSSNPDLAERFAFLENAELMKAINKSDQTINKEKQKKWTQKAFDEIYAMTVEVPVHQKSTTMLYSSSRIRSKTMTKNTTMFYSWMREIQNIDMQAEN